MNDNSYFYSWYEEDEKFDLIMSLLYSFLVCKKKKENNNCEKGKQSLICDFRFSLWELYF